MGAEPAKVYFGTIKMNKIDLNKTTLRELNSKLQQSMKMKNG